jgi:peptidoglycan/LPS O-acetylase OafA/YrhL
MSRSGAAKYHALDAYRFFAAMGVVLLHYLHDFRLVTRPDAPFVQSLHVMVDFFFVLSGFVIAVSYRDRMSGLGDYGRFLKARIARIYPLHLLTLAAMAGAAALASAASVKLNHPEALGPDGLIPSLFLIHAWGAIDHLAFNAASWSLSAEWFVYLLTPLFFWLSRRISPRAGLALALALVLVIEAGRHAAGARTIMLATYDFGALRALPSFLAGVFIAAAAPALAARPGGWARWGVAHLLGAAIVAGLWFAAPPILLTALFAAMMTVAATCEALGADSVLRARPMRMLGDMSFAIYMLHFIGIAPVFALRKAGLLDGGLVAAAAMVATIALVLALSWASFRWFETPMRRAVTALGTSRRDVPAPVAAE